MIHLEILKKICTSCKREKFFSDFYNHKNDKYGKHHICKVCMSVDKKRRYQSDKLPHKRRFLKSYYNTTPEKLTELAEDQYYRCKICDKYIESISTHAGLHIDHCHITGSVRGLLCKKCNLLIGMANDDVNILLSAVRYLQN